MNNLSEEEKKAIETNLKCLYNVMNNFEDDLCEQMQEKVSEIKQFIEKQNKEIKQLRIAYKLMEKEELEIKDKMIDEMAEAIKCGYDIPCLLKDCEDNGGISCENCIKEYFRKKVENG